MQEDVIEKYLDTLLNELEDLETVSSAKLYSGEFHIEDVSKFRIPMSQDRNKCVVLVDYDGGPFEDNPVKRDLNYLDSLFTIYVLGYTRKDTFGFSAACTRCISEINRLVQHKEFHKISGAEVGYSKPGRTFPMANGIKKGQNTLSLHIYTYTQRLDFSYE